MRGRTMLGIVLLLAVLAVFLAFGGRAVFTDRSGEAPPHALNQRP